MALAPAFVGGFAVQRLLELGDPVADGFIPGTADAKARWKKGLLGIVAILTGAAFALVAGVRVLDPLTDTVVPDWLDIAATALVVSAGTEGINSVMKFLGDKKEEQKVETKEKQEAREAGGAGALDTRTLAQVG